MCYLLDMIHEAIVICFLPLITVAVSAGDVIHNKVDVYIIRVGMDGINHLMFRGIVFDDLLGKPIGLLGSNMLVLTKTEH